MRYEYISWDRFYRLCGLLYEKIERTGYTPDLIIAITRGGYPVARVMADYFDTMELVGLKIEHYRGPQKSRRAVVRYPLPLSIEGRQVLLVDDVSDSGDTFDAAFGHLASCGEPTAIRTAVLHHKETAHRVPDFYARRVVKWRWITYPWAVVEDLTTIVAKLPVRPVDTTSLNEVLVRDFGLRLPARVIAQVAPIVLQRLAATD